MLKLNVCVLFGGISPEHEVSLRSAESVLNNMDPEKYNIIPVAPHVFDIATSSLQSFACRK